MPKFNIGERVWYKDDIYFVFGYIPYHDNLTNVKMTLDRIVSYIIAKNWDKDELTEHKVVCESELKLFNNNLKDIQNEKHHIKLTIGELKSKIKDMSDNGLVLFQRIEDQYFEKMGWVTYEDINKSQDEFILSSGAGVKYNNLLIYGHY